MHYIYQVTNNQTYAHLIDSTNDWNQLQQTYPAPLFSLKLLQTIDTLPKKEATMHLHNAVEASRYMCYYHTLDELDLIEYEEGTW